MLRRIMMAAAGYVAYRWWNKRSDEAPPRKTGSTRVAVADPVDGEVPRRN